MINQHYPLFIIIINFTHFWLTHSIESVMNFSLILFGLNLSFTHLTVLINGSLSFIVTLHHLPLLALNFICFLSFKSKRFPSLIKFELIFDYFIILSPNLNLNRHLIHYYNRFIFLIGEVDRFRFLKNFT